MGIAHRLLFLVSLVANASCGEPYSPPLRSPRNVTTDAPLAARPLPSLDDPEGPLPIDIFDAFAEIGSVDIRQFEGVYAYAEAPGELIALGIESNVLRFGAPARGELAPVRVIERDADELLAIAVWHEDIDDPGDASLVYLLLRATPEGITVRFQVDDSVFSDTSTETLVRLRRSNLGLDFRADVPASGVLPWLTEFSECSSTASIGLEGEYQLDLRSLPPIADMMERNIRDSLYWGLVGRLRFSPGRIANVRFRSCVCFDQADADTHGGFVVPIAAHTLQGDTAQFLVHVNPTEDGAVVRFVPSGSPAAEVLPLTYRRIQP